MQPPSQIKAYAALLIGALAVSTSAIFVKWSQAPSAVIAFYRLFFAVVIMTPFFLRHIHELKHISRRDWLFSVCSGVLLAFHFILWFESLDYTSVTSSVVLVTLQPLFAFAGGALFFRERLTIGAIGSALLAIAGSILISWGDFRVSGEALYGDMLALLACAMVTAYWLFGQELRQRLSLMTYTYIVYGISAVTLYVYTALSRFSLTAYQPTDWLCFLALAIVPTLFGHSVMNWAVKWVSASTVSMVILFEPIGASALAYWLFDEQIRLFQWVGGIFILTGISLYLWEKNEKGPLTIQESSGP
ncbi:EamA family transporter [Geobacillus sp. 46C-IIa]|uniref:DMT family transporter n=1 Tax=Geobacillus sp. 46C-IIa TaxID=1963025 RepID=UPI0009C0699E|nr:DMT family transporter [Geobacillus sp. 46C-IIa]OQP07393.1 EamA family transporter [Geobacillus sp. 46C-IIa]QNU28435.1 DMT family transporter [Geobacillus sp. 46C-IIa]